MMSEWHHVSPFSVKQDFAGSAVAPTIWSLRKKNIQKDTKYARAGSSRGIFGHHPVFLANFAAPVAKISDPGSPKIRSPSQSSDLT